MKTIDQRKPFQFNLQLKENLIFPHTFYGHKLREQSPYFFEQLLSESNDCLNDQQSYVNVDGNDAWQVYTQGSSRQQRRRLLGNGSRPFVTTWAALITRWQSSHDVVTYQTRGFCSVHVTGA